MAKLTAIVLGAGAGGGVPQWNCRCAVCALARSDPARVKPRTQASLAVSADGHEWVLLNAAPDLRAQIAATPQLQPRSGLRDTPITAVILTGAEIDQIAGLLNLRERQAFTIFATEATLAALSENPMFDALRSELVRRQMVKLGENFEPAPGLTAELYAVSGKAPLYFEGKDRKANEGVNVGVDLRAGDKRLAFVPGAADAPSDLTDRLKHASVIFFDGTLFKDDEMITTGTGTKTGRRMGHMPIDGSDGSLRALAELPGRKIYIHLNNTNPALIEGSPERKMIEQAGWAIAEDGLEIVL